jgi:tRNA threonylcarbamoyladenosine biosynthesis protein TsaB
MNKLIIDAANENIFLMVITNNSIYNISHPNSKINYEKLTILINNFLKSKNLVINDFEEIYINRGPGSFAGIRNSLSVVKAINIAIKIDYYCYSFQDFDNDNNFKYENIPNLCNKFNIKKNFINPIYLSKN